MSPGRAFPGKRFARALRRRSAIHPRSTASLAAPHASRDGARSRSAPLAALAGAVVLALAAPGCIRFTFWAGEHELTVPPEPAAPTPEPTPEEAAPLVG